MPERDGQGEVCGRPRCAERVSCAPKGDVSKTSALACGETNGEAAFVVGNVSKGERMDGMGTTAILGIGGLLIGLVFGAVVQRTNFCTLGGVSDYLLMEDGRRLRAWVLSAAVALAGTQALHLAGLIYVGKSIYLNPSFGWAGAILGGLMFGFGMTKTGGCASKTLVRFGGGNLKSLVVLMVMGLVAYMTLRGVLAPLRVQLEAAATANLKAFGLGSQGLDALLARLTGLPAGTARIVMSLLAASALLAYCFKDAEFRRSPRDILAGLVIGLTVVAGWVVTGILAADEFAPVQLASLTFAAPVAESLQYLMTWTGATLNFGIAVTFGVILGSFLTAVAMKRFRLEGFVDRNDLVSHLGGATLMGAGAVLALGCTIGQGVTGVSTLALGGFVTWAAIIAGAVYGIRYLEEGSYSGALKAVFSGG